MKKRINQTIDFNTNQDFDLCMRFLSLTLLSLSFLFSLSHSAVSLITFFSLSLCCFSRSFFLYRTLFVPFSSLSHSVRFFVLSLTLFICLFSLSHSVRVFSLSLTLPKSVQHVPNIGRTSANTCPKSAQHRPNICPKAAQYLPKLGTTPAQNRHKIDPTSVQNRTIWSGKLQNLHSCRPKAGRRADFDVSLTRIRSKSSPETRFPARKHYCVT